MQKWRDKKDTADIGRVPERSASASDAELVHGARRGDKRAFVEIVARHQAMVCGIALGVLGDFAASEDAAQEAFLTAWRKIHDLREPERLRAWLGQIARHAALGQRRRQKGHGALEEAVGLADESPAPDEIAASEEEAGLVRQALARLPETYRLPLVLFYREGQSVRAVAAALNLSEDAIKQRLARGREMLRDGMAGLIETVLTRTGPGAVFTMTLAAAIGALAAPAVVAGGVFAAASATTSTATASTTPLLTAMSTSKAFLVTTALVAVVCVPLGYRLPTGRAPQAITSALPEVEAKRATATQKSSPSFEGSELFAEWRALHDRYGTNALAMPVLYKAIADLKDPFRRRAFRAALIAEWVQVEPAGGLAFFLGKGPDETQRRQFFEEWLALDARAAVDALMNGGPDWEKIARDCLPEIARRVPARVADIAARLPKADSYWDTNVRQAFAVVAEGSLTFARRAAEAMTGPSRDQALGGVAQVWGRSDLDRAIQWARGLPDGTDRDEIIRAALLGKAAVDPVSALEQVGIVPSGGRHAHASSTTGARVLIEAAKADFDATVAWLAARPGRLGHEDLMGLSQAVTERLNADASRFLTRYTTEGSLAALLPAIESALLNHSSGQKAAVWDWLKVHPETEATQSLKAKVLNFAGFQDPELALQMVADLPQTADGNALVQSVAKSLFNGGHALHRFEKLIEQTPERLRQPLLEAAFGYLNAGTLGDPQLWITRLHLWPEASRPKGIESIARAWAQRSPEEAIGWVASQPPGETRQGAVAAITSAWAKTDAPGAAEWVALMAPGVERDRSVGSLVLAVAERYPHAAWDWALGIDDRDERSRAAAHAAKMMAARDPALARQWIDTGPFTPQTKAELQSALEQATQSPRAP